MKKEKGNMISDWLEMHSDPQIEIKVLEEVIDSLLQQQERSYSEEEVLDIFSDWFDYRIDEDIVERLSFKQWFEQFKKKHGYEKL